MAKVTKIQELQQPLPKASNDVIEKNIEKVLEEKAEKAPAPEEVFKAIVDANTEEPTPPKKKASKSYTAEEFRDLAEGKEEIPEKADPEFVAAIVEARKHLPRNIQCKGAFTWHSINEMSKTRIGYSNAFLKKKGLE